MNNSHDVARLSRRSFLAASGGVAAAALLAACSSGGGSAKPIKFWNMPWGGIDFAPTDKQITLAYKPSGELPPATYQSVQWANFTTTFASAVASNTGPAVSSGSGTQAFQFAKQHHIAYADDLLDSWKKNGLYDDFLPGVLDAMKTPAGYVAVPYNLDMRVLWYRKALLEKAGVTPPKDWQSYLDACEALKKIGTYGFGIASGAQGNGFQILVGLLINNGGGLFDKEQKPNCVTQENLDALDFVVEMVRKGYMDPGSVGYSTTNAYSQWKADKFAMGFESPGLAQQVGGAAGPDIYVGDPLVSGNGKKGALYFPNNIMMYTNTPSQKGSEAFLTYYYKNMAPLWTKNTGIGLPVLKSIAATKEFQADPNAAKMISVWQPICKTWAAPGGDALFSNVTLVDSTPAMTTFAQSVLSLKATPKEALTTLQNTLVSQMK
ncbi:extracellular solute-binding protein [Planctomonas sp. JC2975]|uniref:ABC transporter substrate-binding protein n=1 Tax=Planctomonas sp. JC2975 TaxID=2729626 RepID=UPI0014751436|nr:extracellular solute-binding protein [Planctomonas sp. JC2975]NNC12880.1 extracellular solute-binding protein [Planctomonas sp. JC2975]